MAERKRKLIDLNYFIDKMNIKALQSYCRNCNDPKKKPNTEINPKSNQDDLLDFEFRDLIFQILILQLAHILDFRVYLQNKYAHMKKKKLPDLQIVELFLVKADWNGTFMTEIISEKSNDGKEIIRGSVVVNEGKIWCVAESEEELGNYLDEMCILKLGYNQHSNAGIAKTIFYDNFFLN